jgi:YfiH family protein
VACAVLVADCLPVLFCTAGGEAVGAAHAGWRGLSGGVLEITVTALCCVARCGPDALMAWLGPCIGPRQFEVGADVLQAFAGDEVHFVARPRPDGSARWLADLPALARERLSRIGVDRITGGQWCTVEDRERFFSFRRDRITGRMAAAIALR